MIYLIAAAGFLLFNFILALFLTRLAFFPKTWDYEESLRNEIANERFSEEFYNSLPKQEFYTESPQGYKLHGIWVPQPGSVKVAVIAHGHTYSLFGSVKYLKIFRERGFSVLIYDQPFHGNSGGSRCSMGYLEKDDLECMVDWAQSKVEETEGRPASFTLTHGESMGAATVLLHAGETKKVDAVIADCSFRTLRAEFFHQLRTYYRLPGIILIPMAALITRIRVGVPLRKISPERAVEKSSVPVFFIHGTSDRYIPMSHSIRMYDRKADKKRLFLMPEAKHAYSVNVDPQRYESEVDAFLSQFIRTDVHHSG